MDETSDDQAPEQSLEDRVAAQFDIVDEVEEEPADDEPEVQAEAEEEPEAEATDDEATTEEESDEPELATVEIEGLTFEVPTDQAEAIKESVMRHADYTQKTQKVADTMRSLELQREQIELAQKAAEFDKSVSQERQAIAQIDAWLRQANETDLQSMDAKEIAILGTEIAKHKEYRSQLEQTIQGKEAEFNETLESLQKEQLQKGQEALQKAIPGWDGDMAKAVSQYAQTLGFTEAELKNASDPRAIIALNKARLYDELKASTGDVIQKAKEAPAIRPKAKNPMPDAVKQRLNKRNAIKRAKTPQEKEAAILGRVADMF